MDEATSQTDKWSLDAEWMTRAEFAEMIGVSVDTAARWETRRMGPPCVRIGRKMLYRRAAVHEWLIAKEQARLGGRRGR